MKNATKRLPFGEFSLFLLLVVCGGAQADRIRVRAGDRVSLPASGVRVRSLDGLALRPQQAPRGHRFTYRTGDGREGELTGFAPHELWVHEQTAGRFVGEAGTLRILEVTLAPPGAMRPISPQHPYVTREVYKAARKPLESHDGEELKRWVAYLTGAEIAETSRKVRGLYLHHPYIRYQLADNAGTSQENVSTPVYLVALEKAPLRVFAVWLRLNPEHEYRNVQDAMFDMLRDLRPEARTARRGDREADRRMQSRYIDAPQKRSDAYERTREAVIRNIRNLPDWWFVETPAYVIASDLPSRRRRFVRDLQENLHVLRSAYEAVVPVRVPIEEVSVVRVFAERRTFQDYLGASALKEWALGLWTPARRELVISPFEEADDDDEREAMLRTVYHEGFHQYVYYALGKANIPIWINEGHATFFEGADIDFRREHVEFEEVENRFRLLESILDSEKPLRLGAFMRLSQQQFYAERGRLQRYSLAWGLVYFLRKGAPQFPDRPYAALCKTVFDAAVRTKDWRRATEAGIETVDLAQLEEDFRAFWEERSMRHRAERHELLEQ